MDLKLGNVYQGDCNELIQELPDNIVDLIISDPPYGYNLFEWDKQIDLSIIDEYYRVLTEGGCVYHWGFWNQADQILKAYKDKGFEPQSCLIWWFRTGIPQKTNYRQDYECCWFFSKGTPNVFDTSKHLEAYIKKSNYKRYNKEGKSVGCIMIHERIMWNHPEAEEHPTQKPIKIIKRLIEISSKKGDVILDPFCGSGTTLLVSKQTGRRFIGFEIDENYVRLIKKRLQQEVLI